jgi:hypothetical protein
MIAGKTGRSALTLIAAGLVGGGTAGAADPAKLDWSAIPKAEIILFYPGQSSQEWLRGRDHSGAKGLRKGEDCVACHKGEEEKIGKLIASGKKLEPKPISGFPGSIKLTIQAAHDGENLYLRASWPAKGPGIYHEYAIFRGGKWEEPYGSHRGNELVRSGKTPPSYEDRFSIMLGDGKGVPAFGQDGCWVTCHSDMRFMPDEAKKDDVQAHPILGQGGMKKSDIRKYLPDSRTAMGATGGWDRIRSKEEIAALKDKGVFLDLWQWRANRSNHAKMADDGYVLEYRNSDAGKNMFADNWDKDRHQPRLMFDPAKNKGRAALSLADFQNPKSPYILLDTNAVPFDPAYKFKEGDLIPIFNGVAGAEGSAADNAPVVGTHAKGRWTVTWRRKLDTGKPRDDIALKEGETYPIGLAVHDDMTTARWHFVSFPLKLSIGGKDGDINAVRLK